MVALNYTTGPYDCPERINGTCTQPAPGQNVNRLVTVSGGNIVADNTLNLADPQSMVTPILQAQDGTYFGTGLSSATSMDSFDKSGSVKWSVPNFTPVIATADGGLIAQSSSGQYVTFDQNGVANGMLASLPTYSWVANAYQDGPADRVAAFPLHYATSFLAMVGANNSANGTAAQQTWFPPLDSCYDLKSTSYNHCPGPYEVGQSALTALRSFVPTCTNCAGLVFQPLGSVNDQAPFSKWLNQPAGLFDGTQSNMQLVWTCNQNNWSGYVCAVQSGFKTVGDWFQRGGGGRTNITKTPFRYGLLTFYDPFFLTGSCAVTSSTTSGLYQQSILFHEALHGFYGKIDADIQQALGLSVNANDSTNITRYIFNYAFGRSGTGSCAQ